MNAKVTSGETPGGKRMVLGEVLPLETPYLISIFPVYGCNFRCAYCLHALDESKRGFVSSEKVLNYALYKKCIDNMRHFPGRVKMIRFAGTGEPLLHRQISDMVEYAKKSGVAENVNIVTNAALLTRSLSQKLIDAKLDTLRISIQGLTAERYKEISGVDLDFDTFLNNIRYFYEHRGETQVHIKIIDCALRHTDEETQFFELFGGMCDTIAIEYMTPTVKNIDYAAIAKGKPRKCTQSGGSLLETDICAQPFYMMQFNPDGNVVPCCSASVPVIFGDIKTESPVDIWNKKKFTDFRVKMLGGAMNCGEVCSACALYRYGLFPEDILDGYAERLIISYEKSAVDQ